MSDPIKNDLALVVEDDDSGQRLDRFLAGSISDLSRERLKALILAGEVQIDDTVNRNPAHKIKPGNRIALVVPEAVAPLPQGENIALAVVFEDSQLIVIDKPPGLVTHPAPGNETGTLVNALIAHCGDELSGIGGVRRPGIVHRLDKDTSGLLVVAKTDRAHQSLSEQFQAHGRDGRLQREYLALAWGDIKPSVGTIDAPLIRSPHNRRKMAIARPNTGRRAVTHYSVERNYTSEGGTHLSFARLRLETGRTHQIRVHLASIGHPLLGDRTYGAGFKSSETHLPEQARSALNILGRQALHAALLGFEHPVSGDPLSFKSDIPEDLEGLLAALI